MQAQLDEQNRSLSELHIRVGTCEATANKTGKFNSPKKKRRRIQGEDGEGMQAMLVS
jgi:hypothetical protein